MRIAVIIVVGLLVASFGTQACAAQRVLIRFDESGFHVHRVIRIEHSGAMTSNSNTESDSAVASLSAALQKLTSGRATLIWQDQNLEWIEATVVPDPRITHSPSHADGDYASRTDLSSGAWIADGPDDARRVVVLLPAAEELGLAFEQWPLWLDD
jgi:hypothetical protein